jgi:hypothetical protein
MASASLFDRPHGEMQAKRKSGGMIRTSFARLRSHFKILKKRKGRHSPRTPRALPARWRAITNARLIASRTFLLRLSETRVWWDRANQGTHGCAAQIRTKKGAVNESLPNGVAQEVPAVHGGIRRRVDGSARWHS